MELWCRNCGHKNTFPRNWLEDADACKECKAMGQWRTHGDPSVDYALSENDKRFLKSLRIDAE